jgi:hypothetical protein
MDRRKSLKAIALGTVSTALLLDACKLADKKEAASASEKASATSGGAVNESGINRMKEEAEHEKQVTSYTFFTPEEMATITVLADIIIPKDDVAAVHPMQKFPTS